MAATSAPAGFDASSNRGEVSAGPSGRRVILIAAGRVIDRPARMGAKYLPTIKDQKASQRFQEQQNRRAREKKLAAPAPAKKPKQK